MAEEKTVTVPEVKAEPLTLDAVTKFIETNEDGKSWLHSKLGKQATALREKIITEEFPKLLDTEITKRYPAETPEQKKLKDLEIKFQQAETDRQRTNIINKMMKVANEKSIPDFLVDVSADKDEETSIKKLTELNTKFQEIVNAEVKKRFEKAGRTMPVDDTTTFVPINSVDDLPTDAAFYSDPKNVAAINELLKKANI